MGLFDFLANDTSGPGSYQAMDARRKIAIALMSQRSKGFPKNIGEGLTAVGDAIGERRMMNELARQEAAYQKQATAAAGEAVPAEAQTPGALPPVITQPPRTSEAAPEEPSRSITPTTVASAEPGVEDGGYNFIDAQAGGRFKPTPGYMQDAIAAREKDPDMQAYYGSLSGSEAKNAQDVSPTGAAGPFQFTRGTGQQYGIPGAARLDPGASTDAVRKLTADNAATFQRINGRAPTFQELALMHQQGGVTGSRMAAGTGNAPPANLAVNNIPPGASPQAAVAKINRYYGMPNETAPRDAIAATMAARPPQAAPDAQDARLSEVTGMSRGPTGAYSYPSTASLPRTGDVQPDTPNISGISPAVGAAAADTLQSRPPPVPQVSPITAPAVGPPPEAQANRPIVVPDIKPQPAAPVPAPGVQTAQAAPPPTPQRLTPQERMPLPTDVPMGADEARGYRLRATALALGDPNMKAQAEGLIAYGANQRKQVYDARLKDWQDQVAERRQRQAAEETFVREGGALKVQREAEAVKKAQDENRLRAQFGNLPPDEVFKQVTASRTLAKGAQQALIASRNAMDAFDKGAITGIGANQKLDLAKLLTGMGLVDQGDRVRNTEVFRNAMQPIIASILHQTSGTSQLSEGELRFAQRAAAGDITLEPASIRELMRIIDKRSTEMINDHSTLTGALFGKDSPQANALFGVEIPKEIATRQVNDQAKEWLLNNPNDPRAPAVRYPGRYLYHNP